MAGGTQLQSGNWMPVTGADALFLTAAMFVVGASLVYLGTRLSSPRKVPRPSGVVGAFMVAVWFLSLVTLLLFYGVLAQLPKQHTSLPSPITPVTMISGIASFVIIAYICRASGPKVALGSALVGTAAAPMIFELPFDLIISGRTGSPFYLTLLFFSPLILVEISSMSLVLLSPRASLSKYTLFALGAMFLAWAVWAAFGFGFPSDPVSFALNSVSKVLAFVTAITLFLDIGSSAGGEEATATFRVSR